MCVFVIDIQVQNYSVSTVSDWFSLYTIAQVLVHCYSTAVDEKLFESDKQHEQLYGISH